jgi:hypothetical protein
MKTFLTAVLLFLPSLGLAQNAKGADHAGDVDSRGDHAMGFSHEKTAHHFTLLPDGGIIAVEADSKTDAASRDQIRMHLTHIVEMFAANDFDVPMFIHDKVPPGVPVMKQKQKAISYVFEPTASGGRVRITTRDAEAVKAVHEFLRFQIEDHRTGDAMTVKRTR